MSHKVFGFTRATLKNLLTISQGQVSDSHEVGRWIRHLASLDEVLTILEIGTWNGLGTSQMVAQGVLARKSTEGVTAVGLEANKKLYFTAKSNLKKYSFYHVIWGTVITKNQLDISNLSKIEEDWLLQDIRDLQETPFVLDSIPDKIDFLILDGGEFSTYAEYQILQNRVTKWIILDDTNTRKCKRILQEIQDDKTFAVVWSSNERNGTAVLLRDS